MKYYHNPRCSKSRQALDILREKGQEVEVVEYLKNPLSKDELKSVLSALGIKAEDLLRKKEADFKTHFQGKELSEDDWVQAMIDYPKLMERPIIVKGKTAVIGRPPEKVLELI